ncbi:LysR family transcriptional regulator [Acuticoccus sediminis]|uniref:LysR family transcriptional regulator n=1 Tax=Acuticoccus sediminis TaxID=2184697 RepID=A0A8B2NRG2_9HYPH|nr:LysR family transcriptional regulator [Acuticoccus sediminis]RAH99932.1 LysR family transcriptional regulator [Acuticoccus sediminis]
MDVDDVRSFVEICEAGGVTPAARRIGASKSVVSRRLARLEAELGARLVNRTTRGATLTPAGEAFKPHAEQMLAQFEAGRDAVRDDGSAIVGRLRISASTSFGATHLAPVLAEFALRHPQLEIQATFSDRLVDLAGERLDAAIRLGALRDSSLVARRIASIRAVVVASPAYLAGRPGPHTLADLRDHAIVAQEHEVWRLLDGGREVTVSPRARFVADSGHVLLAAVLAGVGIARLPLFLCAPAIESGALEVLLPQYGSPEIGLYVVRPPSAGPAPAKVRALTELLLERFAHSAL